jgi:hypothetical protein
MSPESRNNKKTHKEKKKKMRRILANEKKREGSESRKKRSRGKWMDECFYTRIYIYLEASSTESREEIKRISGKTEPYVVREKLVGTALDLNIINDVQSNQGAFRGCHHHPSEMMKIPSNLFFPPQPFLLSYQSLSALRENATTPTGKRSFFIKHEP